MQSCGQPDQKDTLAYANFWGGYFSVTLASWFHHTCSHRNTNSGTRERSRRRSRD